MITIFTGGISRCRCKSGQINFKSISYSALFQLSVFFNEYKVTQYQRGGKDLNCCIRRHVAPSSLTNKNYAIGMNRNGVFKIQAQLGRCGIFLTVVVVVVQHQAHWYQETSKNLTLSSDQYRNLKTTCSTVLSASSIKFPHCRLFVFLFHPRCLSLFADCGLGSSRLLCFATNTVLFFQKNEPDMTR